MIRWQGREQMATKRHADILINDNYKRIGIWNVINGEKESPLLWANMKYYSTHKKPENKQEMSFVHGKTKSKSFFRFKRVDKTYPEGEGHEESPTHETYKDIIADLKILNLYYTKKNIFVQLFVSDIEIEESMELEGHKYRVDVFIKFDKSIPEEYFLKWSGQLAFEIKVTHPIGDLKQSDFRKHGIAMFEHSVSDKLMLHDFDMQNEESEKKQVEFITNYLKEKIYGKFLSDPESDEYKQMKELEDANRKIVKLTETVAQMKEIHGSEIDDLKRKINSCRTEMNYLESELSSSKIESKRYLSENNSLKQELSRIMGSKAYKFISRFIK
jgi:hypothetical protein